jgi:hypothetical protein
LAAKGPEFIRPDHRRAVHLTYDPTLSHPIVPPPRSAPTPPRRTLGERLMLIAERVLGGWAPTLRVALMMVAAAVTAVIVVAVTAGVIPAVLCGLVSIAIINWMR